MKPFEWPRKTVHLLSLAVPFCVRYSLPATQAVILGFTALYIVSEIYKMKGKPFFAHKVIGNLQREHEHHTFAKAPLFLAAAVLIVISAPLAWPAQFIAIYAAGFSDTVAAVCGSRWGVTRLPLMSRKTYVGSICFFLSALPVTLYYLPASAAIVIALIGAFLESLPLKDWDNLTVPIFVGFLANQFF